MIYVFQKLTVFIFIFAGLAALNAQSPDTRCGRYNQLGASCAFRSDFINARDAYSDAVQCYTTKGDIDSVVENMLLILDCDKALSEIRALHLAIPSFEKYLLAHKDELPSDKFIQALDASSMFKLHVLDQLGIIDEAIEGYYVHEQFISTHAETLRDTYANYRLGQIYFELSKLLYRTGNFDHALEYIHRSLQTTIEDVAAEEDGVHVPRLILQAQITAALGRTTELNRIKTTLENSLRKTKHKRNERQFSAYSAMARLYLQYDSPDTAFIYLSRLQSLDSMRQHRAEILHLSGDYAIAAGDVQKAEKAYGDAIVVIKQQQGEKNEAIANCHLALGNLYLREKKFERALEYFQRGLYNLSEITTAPRQVFDNPPLASLYSQRNMLQMLAGKAKALDALYHDNENVTYLDASWKTIRLSIRFMDDLRRGYSAETDKSLLVDLSYPVFEHALALADHYHRLSGESHWIDSAFVLMEESKALNLRDAVLHGQARRFAGIPDSLLQLENSLRFEITGKERLIREYRNSAHYQEATALIYARELADKKEQFRQLLNRYERDHPKYYALKHKPTAIGISEIRTSLAPNQTMLEYFVGEDAIYLLSVSAKGQLLHRIEKDFPLTKWVSTYRRSLDDFASSRSMQSLAAYTQVAHDLYEKLIPDDLNLDTTLLIIPDGVLGYISFSSLIQTRPDELTDMRQYDYMVWHHDISYSYSANLLLELNTTNPYQSGHAFICAPVFDDLEGIPVLTYNTQEAKSIRKLTGGRLLSGADCTIPAFYQYLDQEAINILHLATHGSANDELGDASFLVFSGDSTDSALLYARDLYNLDMPMDLVYLSACETGTGELRRGEGIISLARAFFYAGVKSLMTTLWRVEDSRSSQLSQAFYTHLGNGVRKDRALSNTQREYLLALSPREKIYAHPVYWSALIPVGNMQSLELTPTTGFPVWIMVLIALSVLALITLVILRLRQRDIRA